MNKLPFPEPQSDRSPITFDQYLEYTPEKLELWDGFYNYGGQDMTGFHLAVLTNIGLHTAVSHVPITKWLAASKRLLCRILNLTMLCVIA